MVHMHIISNQSPARTNYIVINRP